MTNTREIIEEYCEQKFANDIERKPKIMASMARDVLFETEERLGKSFFEFTSDEMEDYFINLSTEKTYKGRNKPISATYMNQLISYYRDMIQWHMKQTGVYHENVLFDKRFKFSLSASRKDETPIVTKETLERVCLSLDEMFDSVEADLYKLLYWLCYSGCFDYNDLLTFKDKDIDIDARTIKIGNRKIHLKDECFELLKHHHDENMYQNYRFTSIMVPYHGSFIWIPFWVSAEDKDKSDIELFEKYQELNNERSMNRVANLLSRKMAQFRKEKNIMISFDVLYYRGIYDYMLQKIGYDRTVELIRSKGNRGNTEDLAELTKILKEYGARCEIKNDIYRTKYSIDSNFIR